MTNPSTIEQILDIARWAPSGDNTQVWRFELVDTNHVVIHGFDTRDHCVYDFEGRPSQISLGTLIENIVLAASGHSLAVAVERRSGPDHLPTFDVRFTVEPNISASPLIAAIPTRSVQRKPLRMRPLSPTEKAALEAAVGAHYSIVWLEGFQHRLRTAQLLFASAKIRLTMPEAYRVHRKIIAWNSRFSEDRVPDQALGADPITLRMMKWAMHSWKRVKFLNTYFAGTIAPRLQMDFIPSLACAAHFVIVPSGEAKSVDDFIAAGRAVQRFWLTATHLDLQLQPEMTPLIFASYVRAQTNFSQVSELWGQAQRLTRRLEQLLGEDVTNPAVFMGRIGAGQAAVARSTRLPLNRLWIDSHRNDQ